MNHLTTNTVSFHRKVSYDSLWYQPKIRVLRAGIALHRFSLRLGVLLLPASGQLNHNMAVLGYNDQKQTHDIQRSIQCPSIQSTSVT
jgi:hypothetical protein